MANLSSVKRRWRLIVPDDLYRRLHHHLFPGDHDEHGAIIVAGMAESKSEIRLLARELFLAADGIDYVPGKRGYRMLKAGFIADRIAMCGTERLVYLAVHNHGGYDSVQFSSDDQRSHHRGYPALLDIAQGMPVGALVFAENAGAGSIWLSSERQIELSETIVVGGSRRRLTAAPIRQSETCSPAYDRQARLFGDAGQAILGQAKVGIIGLGGAGSLIAEYLGRLGVGIICARGPGPCRAMQFCRGSREPHSGTHWSGSGGGDVRVGSGGWPVALQNRRSWNGAAEISCGQIQRKG